VSMTTSTIGYFTGEYGYLSNFFESVILFEGIVYPTVEHAFQAQKTFHQAERKKIAAANSPGKAKRMGRSLKLRKDWESIKINIMTELVRLKFQAHADLREKLLVTGDAKLVEGNTWNDRFWGVCGGTGKNWLGRILMQIRTELREEDEELQAEATVAKN